MARDGLLRTCWLMITAGPLFVCHDKMLDRITDGIQYDDVPHDYEIDTTDEDRQERTDNVITIEILRELVEIARRQL